MSCPTQSNYTSRPHNICYECNEKMVCHIKGICAKCDVPLHMITDTVAVGSCGAKYDSFDVVVNLNYPENGVSHHNIVNRGKVIVIGIHDNKDEIPYMKSLVHNLLPNIMNKYGEDAKILFHCFAGYSRSVALATAYLSMVEKISYEDAYDMIKEKRKYINSKESTLEWL
jgi:protein-tyrosine phosphatase